MSNNRAASALVDDTKDYIQYLMQGVGGDLNFDQIRDELSQSGRSKDTFDSINSNSPSLNLNESTDKKDSSNLSMFNTFLKNQTDPDISQIQQSAFFQKNISNRSSLTKDILESRPPLHKDLNQPKYSPDDTRYSATDKQNDTRYSANGSRCSAKDKSNDSSAIYSGYSANDKGYSTSNYSSIPDTTSTTEKQLRLLSKQLEKAGFSPLDQCLQTCSNSSNDKLSDKQGLYLISTLSSIICEFESRGNQIKNLQQKKLNLKDLDTDQMHSSTLANNTKNDQSTLANNVKKDYQIDLLTLENNTLKKNLAKNNAVFEEIKGKYYLESKDEGVIKVIIDKYEHQIEELKNNQKNQFDDGSDIMSPISTEAHDELKYELENVKLQVQELQKERELLKLKLMNQNAARDIHGILF
jgi:hypothetical protein